VGNGQIGYERSGEVRSGEMRLIGDAVSRLGLSGDGLCKEVLG
jgi:hypothetical protein